MKTLWKSLLREKCRYRPIDDDEKTTLSHYSHLQRYFPALDSFRKEMSDESLSCLELPSHYTIQWLSADPDDARTRYWNVLRKTTTEEDSVAEPCRAFVKVVHLIHPVDRLREKYTAPPHPLLPSPAPWAQTVDKLHRPFNQAYVDNVANYVLSRIREKNMLPHGVLYYGSYTAISSSYCYPLTEEYDTYRNRSWFWKAIDQHQSRITLSYRDPKMKEQTYYKQLYQEVTTRPSSLSSSRSSSSRSSSSRSSRSSSSRSACSARSSLSNDSDSKEESSNDLGAIGELDDLEEVATVDNIDELEAVDELKAMDEFDVPEADPIDGSFSRREDTDDESDNGSNESWPDSVDICLHVPHIPVSMIVQEAQEGVMDDLLDLDTLDGHRHRSVEWEKRWTAWIFQVVSMLTFLQNAISFTHNDLHTNNLVWRKTDKPYLYYRLKGKTVWRVPTYGRIFSLIDFGRAIFHLGKKQWISDDFLPNEDAAGQYNYGPFYNPKEPKVEPNPSFDLCRLAVSLLSGLFDEAPKKKKGKQVNPLSEEGSWIVYETVSPLYNLLWKWTVDDGGKTIYENRHGEERYEGFDLYLQIAKHVHGAVPQEQLDAPPFHAFVWKQSVPDQETVYSLNG